MFRHHYDMYNGISGYYSTWPGEYTIFIDRERKIVGISICSEKDQFSKKIGREKAMKRSFEIQGDPEGKIWAIVAPDGKGKKLNKPRTHAIKEAIEMILKKNPGAELGVTYR